MELDFGRQHWTLLEEEKKNKFGTNNDASWMKDDEDKNEDEDKDEEKDSLLTSKEPFRMITELIWVKFTVWEKKKKKDGRTD